MFCFFSTIPLTSHQIVLFSIGSHDTYRVYLCCYSHFTTTLMNSTNTTTATVSVFKFYLIWNTKKYITVFFGTYLSDCPTSWNSTCSFTRNAVFSSILLKKMKKEHCFLQADDCDSYLWPLMAILAVLESKGSHVIPSKTWTPYKTSSYSFISQMDNDRRTGLCVFLRL